MCCAPCTRKKISLDRLKHTSSRIGFCDQLDHINFFVACMPCRSNEPSRVIFDDVIVQDKSKKQRGEWDDRHILLCVYK